MLLMRGLQKYDSPIIRIESVGLTILGVFSYPAQVSLLKDCKNN